MRHSLSSAVVLALVAVGAALQEGNVENQDKSRPNIDELEWTWDKNQENPLDCAVLSDGRYQFQLETLVSRKYGLKISVLKNGKSAYSWEGHYYSVFRIENDRLYYADWDFSRSGGQVVAVDLENGKEIWRTSLNALGPIVHFQYLTRLNLKVTDHGITVYGDESQGRYIEVKDIGSGKTIGQKMFSVNETGVGLSPLPDARTMR